MEQALNQAFVQILVALFAALALVVGTLIGIAAKRVNSYLVLKLGTTQYEQVKNMAATVVRFIEQSPAWTDLDPVGKKEKAIIDLSTWCAEHKIPVTHDLIDKLIEEAVHTMNTEIGKYTEAPIAE